MKSNSEHALLTITWNEKLMFPHWYTYYSQFYDDTDIYVLDNGSDDGHLDGYQFAEVKRLVEKHPGFIDRDMHIRVVADKYAQLQERYKTVLFCEVDEFVVPDKEKWSDLAHFRGELNRQAVQCMGWEPTHMLGEQPIDFSSRPWLRQRRCWRRNDQYDKTALSTRPITWGVGFHHASLKQGELGARADLYMIHIQFMCRDLISKRWAARSDRCYNQKDPIAHVEGACYYAEEIPEKWRDAL